jgi:transposase InsO family protein
VRIDEPSTKQLLLQIPRAAIDCQVLIARIEELVEEFSGYGYRRITAQLRREGIQVNHKKVLRLMRERELLCKPKHRGVKTTDSTHRYKIYPNLLPDQTVMAINQVWISDITYIRIMTPSVYLAVPRVSPKGGYFPSRKFPGKGTFF